MEVVKADFVEVGHEDVYRKLAADLDYRADEATIRAKMAELLGVAKVQIMDELPGSLAVAGRVAVRSRMPGEHAERRARRLLDELEPVAGRAPAPSGSPGASRAGRRAAPCRRPRKPSAPFSCRKWPRISTSPPGRQTRAISATTRSGSGTTEITCIATTVSKLRVGEVERAGVHAAAARRLARPSAATFARALASISAE